MNVVAKQEYYTGGGSRCGDAATFPKRADEYSDVMREKLEATLKLDPGEVAAAYSAIEDLQLVAPHDETVLAAGLALERG